MIFNVLVNIVKYHYQAKGYTVQAGFSSTDPCGNQQFCMAAVTLQKATSLTDAGSINGKSVTTDTKVTDSKPTVPSTVLGTHGAMKCFPNPFSDDLNIDFNLSTKVDNVRIKLFDNQGKLIKTLEQGGGEAGYYTARWNLAELQAGMYHVCLELNDECQQLQRVILMR
jgi:hypothetical protein